MHLRARVWSSPDLLAIALPGPRSDVPEPYRDIIANKDPAHARARPIAVVNANDVSDPSELLGRTLIQNHSGLPQGPAVASVAA
jgi:hypothetical protein